MGTGTGGEAVSLQFFYGWPYHRWSLLLNIFRVLAFVIVCLSIFVCLLAFFTCSGIVFLVSHCVAQISLELVCQPAFAVLGFLICSTMANN